MSDKASEAPHLSDEAIARLLQFLVAAGDLKDTLRSGYTNAGRQESTAEHSWRLALMVIALEPYLEGYDMLTLLKMAIVHDLGEAVTGDVPAPLQAGDDAARHAAERAAVEGLVRDLPTAMQAAIAEAAFAYDDVEGKDAKLAKGLDKLETLLQQATGTNPADFDYAFNLTYGARWTGETALLKRLRQQIDALTQARRDAQGHPA